MLQALACRDAALQSRHLVDEQTQRAAFAVGGQQVVDGILDDDQPAERARGVSDRAGEAAVPPCRGATTVLPRALVVGWSGGEELAGVEQPAAEVLGGGDQERLDVLDRQRRRQQLARLPASGGRGSSSGCSPRR
jgi:hypothetical protein